eukprot:Amastigsp_a515809_32.p1 type:complete len:390 gc:universal Amastigsp_a515809_32:44-1213(+)
MASADPNAFDGGAQAMAGEFAAPRVQRRAIRGRFRLLWERARIRIVRQVAYIRAATGCCLLSNVQSGSLQMDFVVVADEGHDLEKVWTFCQDFILKEISLEIDLAPSTADESAENSFEDIPDADFSLLFLGAKDLQVWLAVASDEDLVCNFEGSQFLRFKNSWHELFDGLPTVDADDVLPGTKMRSTLLVKWFEDNGFELPSKPACRILRQDGNPLKPFSWQMFIEGEWQHQYVYKTSRFFSEAEVRALRCKITFPRFKDDGSIDSWMVCLPNKEYQHCQSPDMIVTETQLEKILISCPGTPQTHQSGKHFLSRWRNTKERHISKSIFLQGEKYILVNLFDDESEYRVNVHFIEGGAVHNGTRPVEWHGKLVVLEGPVLNRLGDNVTSS